MTENITEIDNDKIDYLDVERIQESRCLQCQQRYDPNRPIMVAKLATGPIWWHERLDRQGVSPCWGQQFAPKS